MINGTGKNPFEINTERHSHHVINNLTDPTQSYRYHSNIRIQVHDILIDSSEINHNALVS